MPVLDWDGSAAMAELYDGLPVVRVWKDSAAHHEAHLAQRTPHMQRKAAFDCTHWCTPGVADLFARLILMAMQEHCAHPLK